MYVASNLIYQMCKLLSFQQNRGLIKDIENVFTINLHNWWSKGYALNFIGQEMITSAETV